MFIAHEYTNLFLILEDIQKVYRDPKNGKQNWASKTFRKNKKFTLGGKKRIKFIIGTKDSIPLPDTSYSYVLCRKTLHEFSNEQSLSAMRQNLKWSDLLNKVFRLDKSDYY